MTTNTTTAGTRRFTALRLLLVAAALAISSLGFAAPASAAGGAAPDIRACLKYANGTAYKSKPVYLYRYDGAQGKWVYTGRKGSSNLNGCATFVDVASSRWYAIQGYWSYTVNGYNYSYYNGWTQAKWVGNVYDGLYTAGAGYVYGPYRLN